jgi:hypothetical protein
MGRRGSPQKKFVYLPIRSRDSVPVFWHYWSGKPNYYYHRNPGLAWGKNPENILNVRGSRLFRNDMTVPF